MHRDITKFIKKLRMLQSVDGSFISLTSPDPKEFSNPLQVHSFFSSAVILMILSQIKNIHTRELELIKKHLATFILSQKSKQWTYNYWIRSSKEYKQIPYPDDLDDTMCALAALFLYDRKTITGAVLARVVSQLMTLEVTEGGPYRTWFVHENVSKEWLDVDIAVNANIAFFLSLQNVTLKKLTVFFDKAILQDKLQSPYYPDNIVLFYFIARFYNGKYKAKLKEQILNKRNDTGHWDNPLYESLAVMALLHLGEDAAQFSSNIDYIIAQLRDTWAAYPFYTGVNPKRDQQFFAGSAALTAACCLLAIDMFQSHGSIATGHDKQKESMFNRIVLTARQDVAILQQPLKRSFLTCMQTVLKNDNAQNIALLPYLFRQTMPDKHISDDLLISLGKANVYGWIAYTIYDDFFDDEGKPAVLPVANVALRRLTETFSQVSAAYPSFIKIYTGVMDKLDAANAWEIQECRISLLDPGTDLQSVQFPESATLDYYADRAMGHALGPLALLSSLGISHDASDMKATIDFFRHYLIIRQLNDDAHDFEKDIKKGHINAINAWTVRDYLESSDKRKAKRETAKERLLLLQETFWERTILTVCDRITFHLAAGAASLDNINIMTNKKPLAAMLYRYEGVVQQIKEERKKTLDFLQSYT
jgi:hypothetical protein